MRRLLAPMDSEAPAEFVDFVVRHLAAARQEAARLVGGDRTAEQVCGEALEDLALRWRFLDLLRRLGGADRTTVTLGRCLAVRAKRWRDDQIYPVEVIVGSGSAFQPAFAPGAQEADAGSAAYHQAAEPPPVTAVSVALRKAELLEDTVRADARPLAEAGIAWVHAYQRQRRIKIAWATGALTVVGVVVLGAMPPPT